MAPHHEEEVLQLTLAPEICGFVPLKTFTIPRNLIDRGLRVVVEFMGYVNGAPVIINVRPECLVDMHQSGLHPFITPIWGLLQISNDTSFQLHYRDCLGEDRALCDLFYDSMSDAIILHSRVTTGIQLTKCSNMNRAEPSTTWMADRQLTTIPEGVWKLCIHTIPFMEIRVLQRDHSFFAKVSTTKQVHWQYQGNFNLNRKPGPLPGSPALPIRTVQEGRVGKSMKQKVATICSSGDQRHTGIALGIAQPVLEAHPANLSSGETLLMQSTSGQGYQLIEKLKSLGSTKLSSVSKVRDKRIGKVMAMKVLKFEKGNGKAKSVVYQSEAFQSEVKILNILESERDFIVKLLQADARFLTMYLEYIDGKNLEDMSEDGYFRGEQGCEIRIWFDIAEALSYVHANGIVHNDIKPSNIMWAGQERGAVLCDFGLSTETNTEYSYHPGGSIYYIPPEYLEHGFRGQPGDIWAFGLTMMYVYGMRLPDHGGAVINDVLLTWNLHTLQGPDGPERDQARQKMSQWIEECVRFSIFLMKVYEGNNIDFLLLQMLRERAEKRLSAVDIVGQLEFLRYLQYGTNIGETDEDSEIYTTASESNSRMSAAANTDGQKVS